MTNQKKFIVTTLLAEKGKKYDTDKKCIGSYERSIVFLPADVKPGEIVWVILHEVTAKKDSRDRTMYFAHHAPDPISDDVLQHIQSEAKVLDTMSNFDEETALTLLRARHGTVIDAWKGYRHYYFDQSGAVYGSVFSPATLSLFQYLKRGPVLTEMLLWILGGAKPSESSLYRKRERGEDIDWQFTVPSLGGAEIFRLEKKVADGRLLLSDALIEMRSGALHSEGLADQLWQKASWPTLPVPDFEGGDDVPEIVEHEYGKGLNGQPLLGYAVFGPSDPAWYRSSNEAEEARQEAVAKLAELRQTWQQRDELKPLIEELNVRRERLGLTSLMCERDIFRFGLSKFGFSSYEYTEDNLVQFEKEVTEREEQEAQTALEAAIRKAKQEAEAREAAEAAERKVELQRQISAGEALEVFEARCRRVGVSSNGDGWVILPDGSLREPDIGLVQKFKQGRRTWNGVLRNELALLWECNSTRDVAGSSRFTVSHMPVEGVTTAQLNRVRSIEKEINAPVNAFDLDKKVSEREEIFLKEVLRVLGGKFSPKRAGLAFDRNSIRIMCGKYGLPVLARTSAHDMVDWNKPFDQETELREAQVVGQYATSQGIIEALVYDKWGEWNLNLRLRAFRETEYSEIENATDVVEIDSGERVITEDKLIALISKFQK